jgi:hypothetical protein
VNARLMVLAVLLAVLSVLGLAGPAAADHLHVRLLGNGQCVILAANGAERFVELPNADGFAPNRRHPLHVNVHLGQPGSRKGEEVVWVKGNEGDRCAGYVNG